MGAFARRTIQKWLVAFLGLDKAHESASQVKGSVTISTDKHGSPVELAQKVQSYLLGKGVQPVFLTLQTYLGKSIVRFTTKEMVAQGQDGGLDVVDFHTYSKGGLPLGEQTPEQAAQEASQKAAQAAQEATLASDIAAQAEAMAKAVDERLEAQAQAQAVPVDHPKVRKGKRQKA